MASQKMSIVLPVAAFPQSVGYRVFTGTAEWDRHLVVAGEWEEPEQEGMMKHHKFRQDIPSDTDRDYAVDEAESLEEVDAIDADQDSVASSWNIVRFVAYLSMRLDTITNHMRAIEEGLEDLRGNKRAVKSLERHIVPSFQTLEEQVNVLSNMAVRVHAIIGVRKGTPDEPEAWDVMRED